MVCRRVQCIETMVFILDLRPIRNGEADFAKTADDVLRNLRERMQLAQCTAPSWQREVGGFLGQYSFEFQLAAPTGQRRFELTFGDIDCLASSRFFLFGQGAELLQ